MTKPESLAGINNDLVTEEMRYRLASNRNQPQITQAAQNTQNMRSNDANNNKMYSKSYNTDKNKRNYLEQTINDERNRYGQEQQAETTVDFGNFIGNEAQMFMQDDLSQLPHIDDKIMTNALKNKFEVQKYYVRILNDSLSHYKFSRKLPKIS